MGMPGQAFPGQGIPGQGFPGQGMPGQGFPGQGMPGQAFPGQGFLPPRSQWRVIGGADKGGLIVRIGPDLKSKQIDGRLSTGAIVEQMELAGQRLHYKLVSGIGPPEGWVSLTLAGQELLIQQETVDATFSKMSVPPM